MKRKVTLQQICSYLSHTTHHIPPHLLKKHLAGISVDTRTLNYGDLFFAIPGTRVDPHTLLNEVAAKGAIGAVVLSTYQGPNFSLPLIRVENPLQALQLIAKLSLRESPSKIIAITGSVGKTTTKAFTETLLQTKFRVGASLGNQNSQIGLPLTILNHFSGDEDLLILEMGMTHPGNLKGLVEIAPPDVAILNTVELVHAVSFESVDAIGAAKAEIFSSPHTRLGIVNREIPNFESLYASMSCQKTTFSLKNSSADCFLVADHKEGIVLKIYDETVHLPPFPLIAKHLIHNLIPAILTARFYGVEWELIRTAIPLLDSPERRFQPVYLNGILFINDAYNACELSVTKAMEFLPKPEGKGRKIAVLGSVKELGRFSHECHQNIIEAVQKYFSHAFFVGDEFLPFIDSLKHSHLSFEWFPNRKALSRHLNKIIAPSDVILLKGSLSHELWKVLDDLKEIETSAEDI